jgi:thiamine biosynthesis lipoprotein ApbE
MSALIFVLLISSLVQSSDTAGLIYKKKYVMGTVFEIVVYARPSHHVSEAIQKALDEITRIDDLMSNYKADSALSKLNRSAHFHTETVPPDLYRAIDRSVQLSRLSGGKFDISVAPLVNLWKAALSGDSVPLPAQQQEVRDCVGYEKIQLIPPDQIAFHSNCLQVDLGAIGKGYAVDRAAEILESFGIHNALINAGGSTILAIGAPPGQTAWLVHLRDPSRKIDPQVMLKDESVSTSEQTAPSLLGASAGHIVDPETGKPLKTEFAVSVIAKRGAITDGLSTTLLLLGPTKGKLLVRQMSDVSAVWISPAAQIETAIGGPQIIFAKKSL